MSLVTTIDLAVDYVRAHPAVMTRAEVEEFAALAETIYVAAVPAGFARALPHVPELKPQLESDELQLPPVQFETKLNLPGDWDTSVSVEDVGESFGLNGQLGSGEKWSLLPRYSPVVGNEPPAVHRADIFMVCASPRWFADMAALRKLAEAAEARGEGPPPPKLVPHLTNWREITDALDLHADEYGKVKSLNERFGGPIPKVPKGSQPIVRKDDLIDWWNKLSIQQQEMANQRAGARLSAETQYDYGKQGTVAPEIGGGVKKRRRDRKR